MINIETDVFDTVYREVEFLLPEGCFTSEYVPSPPALPHASLIEMDNYTDRSLQDTAFQERFAIVMYEANVYAEDKFTCKRIMGAIDSVMQKLGFTRMSMRPVDNVANISIHRIVARYRATVDDRKYIFRK